MHQSYLKTCLQRVLFQHANHTAQLPVYTAIFGVLSISTTTYGYLLRVVIIAHQSESCAECQCNQKRPVKEASSRFTELVTVSLNFSCSVRMGILSPITLSTMLSPTFCNKSSICQKPRSLSASVSNVVINIYIYKCQNYQATSTA